MNQIAIAIPTNPAIVNVVLAVHITNNFFIMIK
jgi:hypothetical protein